MPTPTLIGVTDIARTIQLAVAPVFLLAGIGSLLNVIAGRLNRVVDRSRDLERLHASTSGPEHDRYVADLRRVDRRIALSSAAIFLCVAAAFAVCILVTTLFVAELVNANAVRLVATLFVIAMALLAVGLVFFLIEIRVAVAGIRVPANLLERAPRRRTAGQRGSVIAGALAARLGAGRGPRARS